MNKMHRSKIQKEVTLERSLAPLWKATYYSGVLFDWCRPIQKSCFSIAFRSIGILFGMLVLLIVMGFMMLQFAKTLSDKDAELKEILARLIALCSLPLIFITWVTFLIRRKKFLAFFRDWRILEERGEIKYPDSGRVIKRVCIIIHTLYFALLICFFVSFSLVVVNNGGLPSYIDVIGSVITANFPNLSNTFVGYIGPCVILVGIFVGLFFICLADVAPVMVYYHAAKAVQAMELDIGAIADRLPISPAKCEAVVHRMWCNFESLRTMVNRADELFGPMVILNHGVAFFIICGSVFTLLSSLTETLDNVIQMAPVFGAALIFFPTRFLFSIVFMLKVHFSSGRLMSTVARILSDRWRSMGEEERRVMSSFLGRIERTKLAACPSGFYTITPSILLSMLSLIVSYTIIMFQSTN